MTTKKKLNIARDYYFRNYNILDIAEKNNISIEKTQFIIRGYDLTPEVKMVKNLKYELMQKNQTY